MAAHTDSSSPNALSEKLVKEKLAALDWPGLREHLDATAPTDFGELIGHITRCSSIIRQYPDGAFERRRVRFAHAMRSYATDHAGEEAPGDVQATFALIDDIEWGYRQILSTLWGTAFNQRTPETRAAAALSRLWQELDALNETVENHLGSLDEFNAMSGGRVEDEDGNTISPDAVLVFLSRSIAMTLIMEARQNGWFRSDGIIELPLLPDASDDVLFEAGSAYMLALAWSHWRHMETGKRFLGGAIRRDPVDASFGLPEHITEVVRHLPSDGGPAEAEGYDAIATFRLQDRFTQVGLELEVKHRISRFCVGIEDGAALPPQQYVSWEEYQAVTMLADILGYDPIDDSSSPQGLRLVEWVRGYAVLKEMATDGSKIKGKAPSARAIRVHEEEQLCFQLEKCGLEPTRARRFVHNVSLSRRSLDGFDCPLARVGSKGVVLLAPLLVSLNIVPALLSNLAREDEHLSSKGTAFEAAVRKVFTDKKITAVGFSASRGGATYEYDAVVPWDGYVFVFECKNRSLPSGEPASIYYFDLHVKKAADQARRLARALERHPDILRSQFGRSFEDHQIVPCVVHSLPYARLGDIDGVYFTDYSALTRFFHQRFLHAELLGRNGRRVTIRDFWQGDSPTAAAFLGQLERPFQVEVAAKHLELNNIAFPMSESVVAHRYELVQTERTTESLCEALGVDPVPIVAAIEGASRPAPSPGKAGGGKP